MVGADARLEHIDARARARLPTPPPHPPSGRARIKGSAGSAPDGRGMVSRPDGARARRRGAARAWRRGRGAADAPPDAGRPWLPGREVNHTDSIVCAEKLTRRASLSRRCPRSVQAAGRILDAWQIRCRGRRRGERGPVFQRVEHHRDIAARRRARRHALPWPNRTLTLHHGRPADATLNRDSRRILAPVQDAAGLRAGAGSHK
jgi:hypothetical protein